VNCKRKSRRRFFLLTRSKTSPISSEFRGGGFEHPKPPPSVRHCNYILLYQVYCAWQVAKTPTVILNNPVVTLMVTGKLIFILTNSIQSNVTIFLYTGHYHWFLYPLMSCRATQRALCSWYSTFKQPTTKSTLQRYDSSCFDLCIMTEWSWYGMIPCTCAVASTRSVFGRPQQRQPGQD